MVKKSLKDFVGQKLMIAHVYNMGARLAHEMPVYDKFVGNVKDDIQNFAIVSGQAIADVETFYKDKKLNNLTIIVDEKNIILTSYRLSNLPTSIFINASGKPLGSITGPVSRDDKDVVDLIKKVLKGQ